MPQKLITPKARSHLKQEKFLSYFGCMSIQGQPGTLFHCILTLRPRLSELPLPETVQMSRVSGKREYGQSNTAS